MKRVQGSWKNKITATELIEERQGLNFSKAEARELFLGSKEAVDMADKMAKMMVDHPEIGNSHHWYEMTREEQQQVWLRRMNYLWRHADRTAIFGPQTKMRFLWYYPFFGQPPIGLHITMFCTSMKAFASDEQLAEWMPRIDNFDIIGCYCQTEIGHGSDVASLKTTATLDRKTDEFVIHTPSLDATKWWPGEMGRFANHALVFARLLVPDEEGNVNDYGIAPFIVQIREYKTHRHCKGIKTGDLGPKFGYSSKDNGWCTFDNVRVSRKAMLSRFTTIDKEGTFSLEGDPRVLYSTMLKTRVLIFCASHLISAGCLLIAIRYSICRRQFRNISGKKEETKLLDYQTQQMKLFP